MDLYRFAGPRNTYINMLKLIKEYGNPEELSELDNKVLVNEERLRLKKQFFEIYQLGDPQELNDLYNETCSLIDMAIEEYNNNVKTKKESK